MKETKSKRKNSKNMKGKLQRGNSIAKEGPQSWKNRMGHSKERNNSGRGGAEATAKIKKQWNATEVIKRGERESYGKHIRKRRGRRGQTGIVEEINNRDRVGI